MHIVYILMIEFVKRDHFGHFFIVEFNSHTSATRISPNSGLIRACQTIYKV